MLYIGQPLLYNGASSLRYGRELDAFYEAAFRAVQKRVLEEYRNGSSRIYSSEMLKSIIEDLKSRYGYALSTVGENYAREMLDAQLRQANNSLIKFGEELTANSEKKEDDKSQLAKYSLALALLAGVGAVSEQQQRIYEASKVENYALQASVLSDFMNRTLETLSRGIAMSTSYSEIRESIISNKKKAIERAVRIADDQSRKAFISFSVAKMKDMGIKKFRWVHNYVGDEPRIFHKTNSPNGLNGGIFDIDNPPIIVPNSNIRGYPGQLPYCRCSMSPVI